MADLRNDVHWAADVARVELRANEPIGQGSRFVSHTKGRMGSFESTITVHDRPDRLALTSTSGWIDVGKTFTFTKGASGTVVHGTCDPKPKGFMAVLMPVLRPMVRRGMKKDDEVFKRFCESQ